jgi:hypothetical protein
MERIHRRIKILVVVIVVSLFRLRRLRNSEQDQNNQEAIARIDRIAKICALVAIYFQRKYMAVRDEEELLCDIPLEEENQASYKHPTRWQRIEEFQNDDEANNKTNFTKSELRQLVEHFAMEDIVRVPIPNSASRYAFHREELLIYTLIKMKTGVTHTYMEDFVTHSDARRWSYGYKHVIR